MEKNANAALHSVASAWALIENQQPRSGGFGPNVQDRAHWPDPLNLVNNAAWRPA